MKPYSTTLALTLLFLANCQGFHLFTSANSALEEAENTAREGNTKEAILLYQQHLEKRLAVKDRPDWENPYLYLLTIGDLELQQGNVDAALEYYQQAETKQVSKELISDRYRGVALKYESTNQLEQACTILKKYRDRDPLLFDGMLDRISKEIVTREELAHSEQK